MWCLRHLKNRLLMINVGLNRFRLDLDKDLLGHELMIRASPSIAIRFTSIITMIVSCALAVARAASLTRFHMGFTVESIAVIRAQKCAMVHSFEAITVGWASMITAFLVSHACNTVTVVRARVIAVFDTREAITTFEAPHETLSVGDLLFQFVPDMLTGSCERFRLFCVPTGRFFWAAQVSLAAAVTPSSGPVEIIGFLVARPDLGKNLEAVPEDNDPVVNYD